MKLCDWKNINAEFDYGTKKMIIKNKISRKNVKKHLKI